MIYVVFRYMSDSNKHIFNYNYVCLNGVIIHTLWDAVSCCEGCTEMKAVMISFIWFL